MKQETYDWIKRQFKDDKNFVEQFDKNKYFSKLVYIYADLWEFLWCFKDVTVDMEKLDKRVQKTKRKFRKACK